MSSMLKEVGTDRDGGSRGASSVLAMVEEEFSRDAAVGRRMILWSAADGYLHSSSLTIQCSQDGLVS